MVFIGLAETLDPEGRTWGEYMRLSPSDQNAMEAILTPHAFRELTRTEKSFEHMFHIFNQNFSNLPIFTLKHQGFVPLQGVGARTRYTLCFMLIQHILERTRQLISAGVRDQSEFINMSMAFCKDPSESKIIGYTTYCRYTDPTTIGEELVFAFFHKTLRRVVLVTVPGEEHRSAAISFICGKALVLPFDKVCCWCGRTAENLKKCPCKGVRYCNAECQHLHWDLHKSDCPKAAKGA